jgi:hypothetical protein
MKRKEIINLDYNIIRNVLKYTLMYLDKTMLMLLHLIIILEQFIIRKETVNLHYNIIRNVLKHTLMYLDKTMT